MSELRSTQPNELADSAKGVTEFFMDTRQLGQSDLYISRLGLGAWAIGGAWAWGWGKQNDEQSVQTIHQALDMGINWIDTAPVYGLGHSETVVAQALKHTSKKPYIFTKCGFIWDEQREITPSLTRASVQMEVENSLKRLGIDVIDLYQIHWPNPEAQIEEAWATMADLQKQGKIRYLGVSNFSAEQMKRVQKIAPITSLQPHYNLLSRDVENAILPFCIEHGMGAINYSPMASGLLMGKMTKESIAALPADDWRKAPDKAEHFAEPQLSRNLGLVDIIREIAVTHNCSPGEVAIAWTLNNPAITGAIVGLRRPDQVNGIIRGAEVKLSPSELEQIKSYIQTNF